MKPFQVQVLLMTGWNTIIKYASMEKAIGACDNAVSKGRVSARVVEDEGNIVYEKFFNSEEYEEAPLDWQKIEF